MITSYIIDELIRSVNAATNTSNGKWDSEYVEALLPQLRAEAIILSYNGSRTQAANKTISGQWLQTLEFTIVQSEQNKDAEYLVIDVPSTVRINDKTDGLVYVGNAEEAITFKRAFTKTEVAYLKQRGFLRGKEIVYIYTGDKLEIYGNKILKGFQIQGIFTNPTEIAGFNWYNSEYPVDESTIAIMKDLFIQRARMEMGLAQDTVADGADTLSVNPIKANTK
jgi:hypothetical protein